MKTDTVSSHRPNISFTVVRSSITDGFPNWPSPLAFFHAPDSSIYNSLIHRKVVIKHRHLITTFRISACLRLRRQRLRQLEEKVERLWIGHRAWVDRLFEREAKEQLADRNLHFLAV